MEVHVFFSGMKRKHSEEKQVHNGSTCGPIANSTKTDVKSKVIVQEGFSWWTCLQYDMSLEKTKPHSIVKQNSS